MSGMMEIAGGGEGRGEGGGRGGGGGEGRGGEGGGGDRMIRQCDCVLSTTAHAQVMW